MDFCHAKGNVYLVTSLLADNYMVGRNYLKVSLSHLTMLHVDHGILHVHFY